jgi:hypothetical protein
MARYLDVHTTRVRLPDSIADKLVADDILYPCSDDDFPHDLHINPDLEREWTIEDIETIVTGIALGHREFEEEFSMDKAGIEQITMHSQLSRDNYLTAGDDAAKQKKIDYVVRNMALNSATTAIGRGLVEVTHDAASIRSNPDQQHVDIHTSITVFKPGIHFVWIVKQWVIGLIKRDKSLPDGVKTIVTKAIENAV